MKKQAEKDKLTALYERLSHGKAKEQLSHVLQTELPTIPKDSQLYTLPTMPTTTEFCSFLIFCKKLSVIP